MGIEKRVRKSGTKYRANWRNPVTGKVDKGPWRDDELAAEADALEVKKRKRDDPLSFAPVQKEEAPVEMTFQGLSDLYYMEKAKAGELAVTTLRSDLPSLKRFILPIIGDVPVSQLTKEHLQDVVDACKASGHKRNTINRKVSIVKAILNWGEDERHIPKNPVPRFVCKRGKDLKLPPPSPEEAAAIVSVAPPHLVRAVLLGYSLGVRVGPSELLRLAWEEVFWERMKLRVWSADKNQDITYRDLDLTEDLYAHLVRWHEEDKALPEMPRHIVHYKGRTISSFKRAWAATLQAAGITRRIRPYDLRHAFATYALDAGADIQAVAVNMGHSGTDMVHRHYQHVLERQRKDAMHKIDLQDILQGKTDSEQ